MAIHKRLRASKKPALSEQRSPRLVRSARCARSVDCDRQVGALIGAHIVL